MSTNSKKKIGLGTWAWGNELFWEYKKNADKELKDTFIEAIKRGFSIVDTADSTIISEIPALSVFPILLFSSIITSICKLLFLNKIDFGLFFSPLKPTN